MHKWGRFRALGTHTLPGKQQMVQWPSAGLPSRWETVRCASPLIGLGCWRCHQSTQRVGSVTGPNLGFPRLWFCLGTCIPTAGGGLGAGAGFPRGEQGFICALPLGQVLVTRTVTYTECVQPHRAPRPPPDTLISKIYTNIYCLCHGALDLDRKP